MISSLTGLVHVDEFWIGGPEEHNRGRLIEDKKLIVVAIEIVGDGVGRAYAQLIEHASTKELGAFLRKYVSKETRIIADKWKGYTPLKQEFSKLE